jgi:hypothetical protein
MRLLFLALLLANVVFFAWSRYQSPNEAGAGGNPLALQIEPHKLKIVPPGVCLEWGSFTLADYRRAEKALEPLALGSRLAQRRTEESPAGGSSSRRRAAARPRCAWRAS